MTKNIGQIDKLARIVAGALLITLAAMGIIGLWGFVGIVPLATALLGNCPAYSIFGINTCPKG